MRTAILLGTALVLSGCGASKGLAPPKGEALPPAPYGATARPTATELLKPSNQARPERSDEFDLPPPN